MVIACEYRGGGGAVNSALGIDMKIARSKPRGPGG